MESHEACRKAFKSVGCKNVARGMKLSHSIVNKWSEPRPPHGSGLLNPPDRMARLMALTGNEVLIRWLCAEAGGFFVPNPVAMPRAIRLDAAQEPCRLLRDFGALELAAAIALEGPASADKVSRLRSLWEQCKGDVERLVRVLEGGGFRRRAKVS